MIRTLLLALASLPALAADLPLPAAAGMPAGKRTPSA